MTEALLWPILALPVAAVGTYLLVRLPVARVKPQADRWRTDPTPALGGVAIFAGLAAGCVLLVAGGVLTVDRQLAGLFGAVALVFAVGLADDLWPLPAWGKLAGQLGAIALAVASGTVVEIVANDWLAYPLTVLWLAALTNAFNLLDNMDGLAALVAVVSAGLFAASGALDGEPAVVGLATALGLASLGFLPFNLRRRGPAKIFMGDAGAHVLGFSLAALALLGSWRSASNVAVALLVPVLLLAVPILDTALVTLVRLRDRRPLHLGGKDHSSHRLVGHGLSERRAVLLLAGLGALLGAATLTLIELDRPFLTVAGVALAVALVVRFELFLAGLQRLDRSPPQERGRLLAFVRRHLLELAIDALLVTGAYALAYAVRFQGAEEAFMWQHLFWKSLAVLVPVRLATFAALRLYRELWRHAGFRDLVAIAYAVLLSEVLVVATLTMSGRFAGYSRGVFLIDAVLCTAFVAASRLGERWIEELLTSVRGAAGTRRVLIIGAGRAGVALLRELRELPGYTVLGFLDDDAGKQGMRIQRVPILGSCWNATEAIDKVRADLVIVTIPRAPRETLAHVVSACEARRIVCRFALREHDLDPSQFLGARTGSS